MSDPSSQVVAQLASTKGLRPNPEWLSNCLSSQRATTPVQSLVQTAHFRLLASDLITSLARDACLPADVANPHVKERRLQGSVPVQILGVEDLTKSRWEQIEAIEAIERGEGTKGREIIRVTATEEGDDAEARVPTGGTHKLLLQDSAGNKVYGLELKPVDGVNLSMSIGSKLMLRNPLVARGVVMMEPGNTTMLGGKIEGLHKAWKESRKAELRKGIEEQEQ